MTIRTCLEVNLAPCAGIIFLYIFLIRDKRMKKELVYNFFLLLGLEVVELLVYNLELVTASFSHPTMWRVFFSVVGYTLRPFLVYIAILIHTRNSLSRSHKLLLAIPAVVSACVHCTAFFSDIAFSYDKANHFCRGPLGYTSQIVLFLYLVILFLFILQSFSQDKSLESKVSLLITMYLVVTLIAETIYSIHNIGRTSIISSTVFYYMFFQTEDFSISLAKEHLIRTKAEFQAKIDSMTGLMYKDTFLLEAEKVLKSGKPGPIGFVFLDLDYFKDVNDQLGHMVGDQVLREVGEKLKAFLSSEDLAGRFGGDEFCLLLRDLPYPILELKLLELNQALKSEYSKNEKRVKVSASIGAIYLPEGENASIHELLLCADGATYEAKHAGRDRYVLHVYKNGRGGTST